MKISICTPVHDTPKKDFFLSRIEKSLSEQSFQDFEFVVTQEGKMAENTNAAIKKAKGDIVKILYLDDYLAHKFSLQVIVDNWENYWMVTGCDHHSDGFVSNPHLPSINGLPFDVNTIGSPSVLAFENNDPLYFDEELSWLLDVDLYKRLRERNGDPTIINDINVTIGIHDDQMTHILTDEDKKREADYMIKKYA